MPEGLWVDLHK